MSRPRWRMIAVIALGGLTVALAPVAASAQSSSPSSAKPKTQAKGAPPAKPAAKPEESKSPTTGATLVGQFGTWGAYTAAPGGKKICFALAKPTSSKTTPPNRPRDGVYMFVSTRPSEKVANEVSAMIGYQIKPGADSTLEIGSNRFAMYSQGDGLWIKNAAEEERMVEAMRKGSEIVVKGVSAKGTESVDNFSLKGLAQALDKVAQECRK